MASGADQVVGSGRISECCYSPTVLVKPAADALVSTEEIFGPVVCIYPYTEVADAVAQANSLPVAFQAAVFTQDSALAHEVAQALDASAVMINDHTAFRDDVMPFAGLRLSGLGTGGIPYTIEDMQIRKMVVQRS